MPIAFLTGDIFLSQSQTWGHGCNTRGRMGAGVAVGFKQRFPQMFRDYRQRCHAGRFQPGDYYIFRSNDRWILNLGTQASTGGAALDFVAKALRAFSENAGREGVTSLALPRLAAGLGGLAWPSIKVLLIQSFEDHPLPVFVYEAYVLGHRADEQTRCRPPET